MRRTFINMTAEYYRRKDEGFDLYMGTHSTAPSVREGKTDGEHVTPFKRILIVDDETKIRDTYRRIFSGKGFDVLTAANAMEARDILIREKIGILFLDIKMPEVDGATLFELVRAFHPHVKIVVSSVYPIEEQKERIREADAYFDKADGKDVLLSMVAAMNPDGKGRDSGQKIFPFMY